MSVRLSTLARTEQAAAVSRLSAGGLLVLASGQRPSDPETPVGAAHRVAVLVVETSSIFVENGRATIGPIKGIAGLRGKVAWFQLQTSQGAPVLDGGVGVENDGSAEPHDLALSRVDLLAGDPITIHELHLTAPSRAAKA